MRPLCKFHQALLRVTRTLLKDKKNVHSNKSISGNESPNKHLLLQHLKKRIQMSGPLTTAEYMQDVLTHPKAGYYMSRDVFGTKGDFTTSPEISQMFGEMIGIWCVHEWQRSGSPASIQVVELGPGRGTLAHDMLRVFSQFQGIKEAVSVHLVEVSPKLSQIQQQKLCGLSPDHRSDAEVNTSCESSPSLYGPDVFWHKRLEDVPHGFSFFVAHEFFDALPIHKFQHQNDKWREVMIEFDESQPEAVLRYALAPMETSASKIILPKALHVADTRHHVEVCPEGGVLIQQIAQRVTNDGGFALIADYGHVGEKGDTFRAFKEHQLYDPLSTPGSADLTADVDFSYLSRMVGHLASVHGPISQSEFLTNMGIQYRLQALLSKAPREMQQSLMTGYDMMCNPAKMGDRFKFMAVLPESADSQPAGFQKLT